MLRNYYTLLGLAREFGELTGMQAIQCFTQDKDSAVIEFQDPAKSKSLIFQANKSYDSVYLRDSFGRARKNTVDILPDIEGETLQSVRLVENERIIEFNFGYTKLFAVLFGGAKSNLVCTTDSDIIIDALNGAEELRGEKFVIEPKSISFSDNSKVLNYLSHEQFLFGKYYALEIAQEAGIDSRVAIGELSADEFNRLNETAHIYDGKLRESREYFILKNGDGSLLSLIPLKNYSQVQEKFSDLNKAVWTRTIIEFKADSIDKKVNQYRKLTERSHNRYRKNLEHMQDTNASESRAAEYRKFGEILISQPDTRIKTGSIAIVMDFEGNEIKIPTDPKLNLHENAGKYFDKSRAALEKIKIDQKRIPSVIQKVERAAAALAELKNCDNSSDVKNFEKKYPEFTGQKMNEEKSREEKFRKFDLGSGFILYVGKNAANNDELTMKFARPNDIWLHARGVSGSHAVLRVDSKQNPTKSVIEKAAEIAAYYSSARNAKYTPVAYTQKKNVRKPKGANPGAVVISREEVVMVNPRLPENAEDVD